MKGTNAFFLQRSAECTLPYGIDDPQNSSRSTSKTNRLDLPEMIVDLYNAGKSANMIKGSKKPKSAPLIASNYDLNHEESLVVIVCTLFVHRCNTFGAEIMVYLFQIPVADYILSSHLPAHLWAHRVHLSINHMLNSTSSFKTMSSAHALAGLSKQGWLYSKKLPLMPSDRSCKCCFHLPEQ